ncbi:MAG: thiamine pyrophosphate-requiring protein [Deltaproteobacteria bacterium]|nr:thiamine pyrophosphate-requiring protein [Deltaproteobacteria bacterium]
MNATNDRVTVAEAFLELLACRGIRYFFGNSGTDFAPIIEAFAKRQAQGKDKPVPITVPHEICAVAMAHGYTMVTGRPQAVMVHVIVGTANGLGGIINAARARIPMLFLAGRTPLTEKGLLGARDLGIHWAQESFDQGAMVREFVKWDYELRFGSQIETIVDRSLAITRSEPCGPVYLTLPREVLATKMENFEYSDAPRINAASLTAPAQESVRKAADILAAARKPIAIVQSLGRHPEGVEILVALAQLLAMPIIEQWHTHLNFPQTHILHAGYDPAPYLKEADVILAIESDAPWFPELSEPHPATTIIQVASDSLYTDYPYRGFGSHISLSGNPQLSLLALDQAILSTNLNHTALRDRLDRWSKRIKKQRKAWQSKAEAVRTDCPIHMAWASHCVGNILDEESIVINEYVLDPTQTCFDTPGTYFRHSPSAALGWGLGAALGAKLAKPDHKVICCVGDGSYIFGVPVAAHWVSRAYELPVLFIVFNNSRWNASQQSTLSFAPHGWAAKTDPMPLCDLRPALDYEKICRAAGGYGQKVERPEDLPRALKRALKVIETEKRQALINVICR